MHLYSRIHKNLNTFLRQRTNSRGELRHGAGQRLRSSALVVVRHLIILDALLLLSLLLFLQFAERGLVEFDFGVNFVATFDAAPHRTCDESTTRGEACLQRRERLACAYIASTLTPKRAMKAQCVF